jgi:hypothetical protein
MYENGSTVARDDVEAVRLYRLASDQGNAVAQTNLGVMFEEGRGVARDDVEAVRLYRLASRQGSSPARYRLGIMLEDGRGVARDYAEAVHLYRLAANVGISEAKNSLGLMYESGHGVQVDLREAERLFAAAAAGMVQSASQNLQRVRRQLANPTSASAENRLPSCPTDWSIIWNMCFGTRFYNQNNSTYVGEYRNNLRHGQGALFSSNQRLVQNGVWEGDQFVRANNLPIPAPAAQGSPSRPAR